MEREKKVGDTKRHRETLGIGLPCATDSSVAVGDVGVLLSIDLFGIGREIYSSLVNCYIQIENRYHGCNVYMSPDCTLFVLPMPLLVQSTVTRLNLLLITMTSMSTSIMLIYETLRGLP